MRHEIKLRHGGLMVIEGDRDLPEAAVVHRTFNGKLKNMSEDKDGASICEADYISEILRLVALVEELKGGAMIVAGSAVSPEKKARLVRLDALDAENAELRQKVMLLGLEAAALRGMLDQKIVDGKTVITTTITFQGR